MSKYELIDYDKYLLFYDKFQGELKAAFNGKYWERVDDWSKNHGEPFFQIQQGSARWLDEELGRFTNGVLRITHLKYNPQNNVNAAPATANIEQIARNREREIADFKALLNQIVWQRGIRQDSSPAVLAGCGSHTTETTGATTLNSPGFQYRKKWLQAFEKARRNVPGLSNHLEIEPHLLPFYNKLRNHRFDRFIWPEVQYRHGNPAMARQDAYMDDARWKTIDTENDVRKELTDALAKNHLVLMHDDAGMGKTAFSWMLFEHLLKVNDVNSYVIRLEGIWPRSTDEHKTPLQLMEVALEELLGKRLLGRQIQGYDTSSDSEEGFREALKNNNVFILLDGFDQMTNDDRAVAIEEINKTVNSQSDISRCHWLVSGRTFAFRDDRITELIDEQNVLRYRLKRFDCRRQDEYFQDLEQNQFFHSQQDESKRKPLDYMCSTWRKGDDTNDLGIPLHLSEIRKAIEAGLTSSKTGGTGVTLREIHSSSDLHARVSDVYLERAVKQNTNHSPDQNKHFPRDASTKINVLRQVCSCLAIQMMYDCNFNASIDNGGTDLIAYNDIEDHELVNSFIARSKRRYEKLEKASGSYWDWAIDLLEKIEVTHRGDVDTFTPECRAFRDLKAMEWYAAYFLVNYSTEADWNEKISDSKKTIAKSWQGHERWTRCWQLAMEMPTKYYNETKLQTAIENILAPPPESRRRPCEWMWIAWNNRLEQDAMAKQRKIAPLQHAKEVIEGFRQECDKLIEAKNSFALTLRCNFDRDSPDVKLTNPNQTKNGWYRRIPDVGDYSMFKGERPVEVTVSQFWLRKFVVTNDEYRLFDLEHHSEKDCGDLPATNVDWYMATMFCFWLGPGYRLPTEAEWETACRANQLKNGELHEETRYWFGDDDETFANHGWFFGNSNGRPHSLAESTKASGHENRFGLVDMSGGVWEWCSDWDGHYDKNSVSDPVGPTGGSNRVGRGGCWSLRAAYCRSANRGRGAPVDRGNGLGFRVALSSSGIPTSPEADK